MALLNEHMLALLILLTTGFGAALYNSAVKRISALEKETDLLSKQATTVEVTLKYLREAVERIEQRQVEFYNERKSDERRRKGDV